MRWQDFVVIKSMKNSYLKIIDAGQGGAAQIVLEGDWVIDRSKEIRAALQSFPEGRVEVLDASRVGQVDTWGIMQLQNLERESGAKLVLDETQKKVFDFLAEKEVAPDAPEKGSALTQAVEALGRMASEGWKTTFGILSLVGEVSICFARNIVNPRAFRFHSIVRHIEETGLRALPIIALLAVLISCVIAYQAATQLERFGATIFTVDLTVISILREMGVLVTAIMVAGRSGSAFAAEIGVMKLREEVDALKTMGFNPVEVLVLPRLIAMMLTLPMLAFIADIVGLMGGGIVAILLLDIPIDQYIDRVDQVAKPMMFFVGLIKAPVFAFLITIVGAYQGMNVSGSAESVGKLTTVAVVQSIFLVIMADALFSIMFSTLRI